MKYELSINETYNTTNTAVGHPLRYETNRTPRRRGWSAKHTSAERAWTAAAYIACHTRHLESREKSDSWASVLIRYLFVLHNISNYRVRQVAARKTPRHSRRWYLARRFAARPARRFLGVYVSLSLSLYIYIYISVYLSIYLSLSIYIYIYTYLSIYIYI